MVRSQLPHQLAQLLPEGLKTINLGTHLRESHRKEFDVWYDTVFVPNHKKK